MKYCKFLLVFIGLFQVNSMFGQMNNNTTSFIGDGVETYLDNGNFFIGVMPASITTSRTSLSYGRLSFGQNATWSGATSSQFVDGYVRYYGTNSFIFPVGQSGVFAPLQLGSGASGAKDVAYFSLNPSTLGSSLGATISAVSSTEYWNVIGSVSSVISLSWRSASNISSLTSGTISNLTIVGWNGLSWVEIPSTVDTTSFMSGSSTLTSGSISSNSAVNLATFSHFTFGVKGSVCAPLVASSGNTKTWNGSWSPSAPSLEDPVVINSQYSGNLVCNSLVLNADVLISGSNVVEIVNGVTGNGKIVITGNASVVQRSSVATAPKIEITKVTNPMRRLDFLYLSNPITDATNYFASLNNPNNVAVNGNFGSQPLSPFYDYSTFNSSGTGRVTANASTSPVGIGHSAVIRSAPPYSTSETAGAWYTEKYPIHLKFLGTANNGTVNVPIPPNGWIYVGNPYPSAINGEKLLDAVGNNMRKTIYYWTFNTPRQVWGYSASNYTNADYATWNYSGGVAVCPTCQVPTGKIASLQSVLMRGIVSGPSTLSFTNCMRETSGNDNFFRTNASVDNKFRLNITGQNNSFCQTLIAYSENGTLGFDNGYDSVKITSSETSLTTLVGTAKCAIQTRPVFDINDTVPLQLDIPNAQNLTISLASSEGVFTANNVSIYLYDKSLQIYHNLNLEPYTFTQSQLSDNTRFEVVYVDGTLSNPDIETNNAIAFIDNNLFNAQASMNMSEITIFDMAGREIVTYKNLNESVLNKPFHHAQGVYIAKIKLENGLVVTKKLINN